MTRAGMARQAAMLANPSLLWVVLKQRENVIRRLSHESDVATEACAEVLGEDADRTNQLRRNAAIEDRAKATDQAFDKMMKRKPCSRKDPPRAIQLPVIPTSALPAHIGPPPAAVPPVIPLADNEKGKDKAKPKMIRWAGVPLKYKAKYKQLKKWQKSSCKYIAKLVADVNKKKDAVRAAAKELNTNARKTVVKSAVGFPKEPPVPKMVAALLAGPPKAHKDTAPAKAVPPSDGKALAPKADVKAKDAPEAGNHATWICHALARNPSNPKDMKRCGARNLLKNNFCVGCGINARWKIPCTTCGNKSTRVTESTCSNPSCGQRLCAYWPPLPAEK